MCNNVDRDSLVREAVQGSVDALELLLTLLHPGVLARIRPGIPRILTPRLDAEDVAQQTYLKAAHKLGGFKPNERDRFGSFRAWLFQIADNSRMDAVKHEMRARRSRARETSPSPHEGNIARLLSEIRAPVHTPSWYTSREEASAALLVALAHVPPDDRAAVWLLYARGMPRDKVATIMKTTEGAVYKRCRRAMQRLRELLGSASRLLVSPR